ncbi:UBX domain protein [Dictyocaulus viviparus]|uniref:UBX domain protein n=1 Tax=Dictyocaulus viviparus TaxID=29172 RepID=A0A0D8Y333_DICVI|nr:UBX domain protein [Dictyocaulus viviparus]
MSTVVEQLVDMGFERNRVEYAFRQTGEGALEVVMDWLISHEGEEIPLTPQPSVAPEMDNSVETSKDSVLTEHTPGSYKCNDCNKLFRDENGMMFHAAKSGHDNFSESTETIASLTPEERAKKAAELRERIRVARAQKEEAEKKEEIEKERRRREEGKKMLELKEKQRANELRAIAEERRREKQEEAAARQRVLEQIKIDRETRNARASGRHLVDHVPISTPTHSNAHVKRDYSEALSAVREWLEVNHSDGSPFTLLMPFPRKVMTEEDYEKPLKDLGLAPSANLVMTR